MIPSIDKEKIQQTLRFKSCVDRFESIYSGSGDNCYSFVMDGKKYFAKVSSKLLRNSSLAHEIDSALQASELDLTPKIIAYDANCFVMEYIDHSHFLEGDLTLDMAAKALKKLHHSNCDFKKSLSPCDRVREFLDCVKAAAKKAQLFNYVSQSLDKLETILNPHLTLSSPCHFDVNQTNMLVKKDNVTTAFLVDWCDSIMSDPYYDLASFCFYRQLNHFGRAELLAHYSEDNEYNKAKLYLLIEVACLMMMAWDLTIEPEYEKYQYRYNYFKILQNADEHDISINHLS